MRKFRQAVIQALSLVLIVSTLSAISIVSAPSANAAGAGLSVYIKNESGRSQDLARNEFTTGTCHTLTTSTIDYQWGSGSPGGSCNIDGFTVYATGQILAPVTGTVNFCAIADDGFYLTINGTEVINNWIDQGANSNCNSTGTYSMVAGQIYSIKTWMHENGGGATMQLLWSYTGQSSYIIVPATNLGTFCSPSSTSSGGYTILSFTNTATCSWSVPAGVTAADVLIVGGGGAGGGGIGGGGGAGEFIETTRTGLTGGSSVLISVGAGGTSNNNWTAGNAGGQSRFDSVIAYGGGGGGTNESNLPVASGGPNLGSQGGGGYNNTVLTAVGTRSDVTGFRNNGGTGSNGGGSNATGGGGGGAGGPGASGTSTNAGNGGLGKESSITGTSLFYAGGGGGGVNGASSPGFTSSIAAGNPGNGGSSIGGSGGSKATTNTDNQYGNRGDGSGSTVNSNGRPGVVNTGSGGGGASNWVSGGAGGSGVVVIRYVNAPSISLSTSTISGSVNSAISSYSITSSGGPVASYSIPSADDTAIRAVGLSFSTSTGLISGTPTGTLASRSITITATNTSGTSTATFSLAVVTNEVCSPTVFSSGGYTTLSFTSQTTCNWTTPTGVTAIEVAVVGGGGGGGFGSHGGGGGAGEVLITGTTSLSSGVVSGTSTIATTPGAVTVISIGAGGSTGAPQGSETNAGADNTWTKGGNGSTTRFGLISAAGGGGGGGLSGSVANAINGATGGSGGGGATGGTAGGTGTVGSTPSGWTSLKNSGSSGERGGGGGAGSAGVQGGIGSVSGSGSGVTIWGIKVAGGGLGWQRFGQDSALGGNGRTGGTNYPYYGSSGSYSSAGVNGTGSGGGAGAPGGSGVVIVRYALSTPDAPSITGITAGNQTLSVAFNPPSTDGGAAITNYEYSTDGGSNWISRDNWPSTASPLVINTTSGFPVTLVNGTTYNVQIRAVNSVGSGEATATTTGTPIAPTQTITYAAGTGGSGSAPTSPTTVSNGSTFTTPANTYSRTGYTFAGWSDGSATYAASATYPATGTVSGNVTLTATWTANTLTITYDSQSGSAISNGSTTTGGSISASPGTPTRSGYTFNGWFAASAGGAAVVFPYAHGQTANFTLYAQWSLSCAAGGVCVVGDTGPGGGKVFYVAPSGETFACGQSLSSLCKYLEAAPITGASAWTDNSYAWSGNINTAIGTTSTAIGSGYSNTLKMVRQTGAGTSGAGSAARGYRGGGLNDWYLPSKDELNELYINRTVASASAGYWSSSESTATGAWDQGFGDGAQGVADPGKQQTTPVRPIRAFGSSAIESAIIYVPAIAGVTAPVRGATPVTTVTAANGYTGTVSWSGSPSAFAAATTYTATITFTATTGFTLTGVTANFFTVSGTTSVTHSADSGTITAVFPATEAIVRTITYSAGTGGSGSAPTSPTTVSNGSTFTTPANTYTRTGYTFAGWSDGTATYTESATYPATGTVSGNVTLTATWTANSNTLIFDANTGTGSMANQSIASGTSTALTTNSFTKTGHTFAGWNTLAGGGGTSYTNGQSITITAGATLYAQWTANSNTFAYNGNSSTGGTTPTGGGSKSFGSTITVAANTFTRSGYTFANWNTAADGSGTTYAGTGSVTFIMPDAAVTLYAQWTVNTNNFAYNGNTSDGGSAPAAIAVINYGSTVTVAANTFTKAGYTFSGWNTLANGNGTSYAGTGLVTFIMPDAAVTLYAQWTANSNTVTFNANDGSGSPATTTQSITSGTATALTANSFTRTGYTFAGWDEAADGSGTDYTNQQSVTITAGMTLYAKWTANSNTFTFSNNTGSGTMANQSITSDVATAITANTFTKTGYTFAGWNTQADGSGTSYTDGQSITVTAGATLYAQWTANSNTFIFDNNTGSGTMANQSITSGTATALSSNTFTKNGYTFASWNTLANGTGTSYTDGQSITITSGATLYAQWTANSNIFIFDNNTGSGTMSNQTIASGTATALTTNTFTKTGYTFAGWNTLANGTGTSYTNGQSITVTAGATLYAQWTVVSCSPTLTTSGGYTRYTFTTAGTCTWTVPNGITGVEVLAVAGGGGGGYAWGYAGGGGGGGGQVKTAQATLGSTLEVTVGAGGSAGTVSSGRGGSGGDSNVSTITALGGTGGCGRTTPTCSVASMATASAAARGGRAGGAAGTTGESGGGSSTTLPLGGTRGEGTSSDYSGSAVTYGYGGNRGSFGENVVGSNGSSNTGNGGGGAGATSGTESEGRNGGAGGSGLVVIRIANTNTVTFNANDGSGSPATATQSITTGVATTLTSNTFTRTGYTFNGWNLNSAGNSSNYSDGQSVTITGSFTLYAKWAAVTTNAITYDNQGATTAQSGGSTTYTTAAAVATIPTTAPLRSGYTFSGWFTATTGGTQVTNGSYTPPSPYGSITLYARWSAITNNAITYDNQGATTAQSGGSTTYTTAAAVATIPTTAPLRTGFTFSGWFTASTGGTQVTNGSYTPPSPFGALTLYAQWNGISNTFIFNNNTGSGTMANQSIVSGTSTALTSNSFTKTGFTFAGWNTFSNGTGTAYTDGQSITITAGETLYAQWTANLNTFAYNGNTSNGGTTPVGGGSKSFGSTVNVAANTFTKTGYTFTGWNTAANGSGTPYAATGSVTFLMPDAAVTLYAQWTIISSAFAYNGNTSDGGSAPSGSGDKDYGTTITVAANSYTKTGHTFSGWNTAANGSGTSYAGTGLITFAMPDTAVTLYAQWTANTNTLAYNGNTNTGGSTPSGGGGKNFGTTITVAANTFTKTGYTFTAWNTAANGSGTSYAGTGSVTFVMPDASVTLYAQWSANTLVVTFNAQGGTTVTAGSTFTAGSIAAAPTAPTKSNYTFTGWATTIGGSAIEFEYTHGQTADFTLYALWAANVYTVTYVYNSATGGNSAVSDTFTTGGTAITLPTPTRTGYTFAGWHSDSLFATSIGLAGASYSPTGSALSLSAYAKWTAIDYTVTYSAATKTSGAVPVDSANYVYATNVLIKGNTGSLVRTGYTFLGWTSAADGSSTLLTSGSTFSTPAANMTFYAKWSANTYTVTYNKNGASGSPATATDSYTTGGTAVTLTAVGTMVKTGFDFAGWSATPTGSVITGTYTTAVDTTLYAIWTIKSISISFAKGSAINESFFNFPTNRSADYGTLITLSDTVDSSIDIAGVSHAFMGWNDGSSVYQSGATYLLGETAPTFTAVWVKIYAVRYGFNGGTAAAGSSAIDGECLQLGSTCTNGQVITSNAAPSKTGYDFAGWVDQNNQSVPTAGTFTVSATRYLIYATWTPINYAITYNAGGGSSTPASFTKQISQSFSTADAITRVGYTFNGWSDGTSVYGAGATYYVASSPVTLTAQWVANVYTVSYDWNGGSGSSTADASYTVGTTAITLPLVGDHVKDGYNFAGWSTSPTGDLISGGFTPTADTTLYAIWGTGSYTVTYDYNWGSVSNTSASVLNGTSLTLPTPTRANFVFDGWYTARTSGSKVGNAGTSHQPTGSKTLYARWIQSSLYGIDPAALLRLGQTTARDAAQATFIGENATSAVSVTVPAGSLPDGTIVYFDLVGDFTRARTLLSTDNSYIISMVVSWLAPDETVPDTNAGKAISLTIENDSIKAGASIYAIVAGQATLLTTATQNGIVTVALTSDPEVVVIATKPNAPASVVASSNGVRQSVVSWSAPASDGGSAIIGYTVTSSNNQTCTTATTSCAVTGLSDATAYTFTVVATNGVGTSVASSSASATTAGVPGAPTSVTASSGASKQSVIAWAAPTSNGGSSITAYAATSNTGATCSTSSTTCTITGLSDGTTYTFTVTATNVIGISNASTSASARTADVVVPPAPVDNIYAGQVSASPAPSMPAPAPSMPAPAPTPVVVVGNSAVNIPTVEVKPTEPVVTPPPAPSVEVKPTEPVVKPTTVKVDSASQKFISEVKIVDGKVVLTPVAGFSGKKNVTVTINEDGKERNVQIALTVLPEVVTKPTITPTGMTKTTIKWEASPNAISYTIYLDRKIVCSTSGATCTMNMILGPKALVEIISNGGDKTISQRVRADLKVTAPILVGQLVSTTNTKSTLTPVDISTLNKIATVIKSQGFKTVMISEITTTKRTQAAAEARMAAIKKFIRDKTGISTLKFEEIPVTSRTNINKIMLQL